MINYNTDKLIIFCYPVNAGGKFVINSLGLSNKAVLQSIDLAIRQIDGKFSALDKLLYLQNQFELTGNRWNDLDLGCLQFFGVKNDQYLTTTPVIINPAVESVINNNLYFFIVAHSIKYLNSYLIRWPNAKIVLFKNTTDFILSRDTSKDKNEIRRYVIGFDWEINKFKSDSIITWWDSSWFLSESDTLENIKNLYDLIGLPDFNEEYVKTLYWLWISKLDQLKHK